MTAAMKVGRASILRLPSFFIAATGLRPNSPDGSRSDVNIRAFVALGLIWLFSLAFGRTPPVVVCECVTIERLTLVLVVAAAVVGQLN